MDARYKTTLKPNAIEYPAILRRRVDNEHPPAIRVHGNLELLNKGLIGFFCSVRCPGDAILKTYDLARALRESGVTLIGGFQSTMEKEFLDLVLRGSASVVVCPARGLGTMRIPRDGRPLWLTVAYCSFHSSMIISRVLPQLSQPGATRMLLLSLTVF